MRGAGEKPPCIVSRRQVQTSKTNRVGYLFPYLGSALPRRPKVSQVAKAGRRALPMSPAPAIPARLTPHRGHNTHLNILAARDVSPCHDFATRYNDTFQRSRRLRSWHRCSVYRYRAGRCRAMVLCYSKTTWGFVVAIGEGGLYPRGNLHLSSEHDNEIGLDCQYIF